MTRPRTVDLHAHYLVGGVEVLVRDDPRRLREDATQASHTVPGLSAQEVDAIRGANAAGLLRLEEKRP